MIENDGRDLNLFRHVPSMDGIEYVKDRMEELESFLRTLPPIDEQGNSECSFALEVYERKEFELEPMLEEAIHSLHEDIRNVSIHINKVKTNMNEIRSKTTFLHLESTIEKYDQAIRYCEQLISGLNVSLAKGKQTVIDAENVLERSRSTVWPGEQRQKSRRNIAPTGHPNPDHSEPKLGYRDSQNEFSKLIKMDTDHGMVKR